VESLANVGSDRDRFSVKEGTPGRWDVYWLKLVKLKRTRLSVISEAGGGSTMTKTIAELNDRFRKGDNTLGQWMITDGLLQALPKKIAGATRQLV